MNDISMIDGLYITISSMLVVFLTLTVISLILSSFKHVFKEKVKEEKIESTEREVAITDDEDEEEKTVVALAASIMAGEGKINPNLRIKSIKRIK